MASSVLEQRVAALFLVLGPLAGSLSAQAGSSADTKRWGVTASVGVGSRKATDWEYWVEAGVERVVTSVVIVRLSGGGWFASVGCAAEVCHPGSGWTLGPTVLLGRFGGAKVAPYVGVGLHLVYLDEARAGLAAVGGLELAPRSRIGVRGEVAFRRDFGAPSPSVVVANVGLRVGLGRR